MNNERGWTPITRIENVPLREGRAVTVGDVKIAIFHIENRCLTVENKCPHKGGPLCDGIVSGTTIVCPLHGRRFDLETGMAVRASEPSSVATFPTRVEGGIIFVDLGGARRGEEEAAA
jgi:nitrite reductase (NADH) small subunit